VDTYRLVKDQCMKQEESGCQSNTKVT